MSISLFWFRRDLRLEDNVALYHALKDSESVQPIFIFDENILKKLDTPEDARVLFIHQTLKSIKEELKELGSDLLVLYGSPLAIFKDFIQKHKINAVYCNHDYEPEAIKRDELIKTFCLNHQIEFKSFKDQVIFEKSEVLTGQNKPYTVYTPYKKKWLSQITNDSFKTFDCKKLFSKFHKASLIQPLIKLEQIGFKQTTSKYFPDKKISLKTLEEYAQQRDFPAAHKTSLLGVHLRFGTIGIRSLAAKSLPISDIFLSELIWREFFMQILFHHPEVVHQSFHPQYDQIKWLNDKEDFNRWCEGQTGYPIVDAGMRQLNETGYMHNRVRMIVASFLTKHLLTHWLKGERYFAKHLLDFDLAANNGNWQWAAGTGCDASPYFRVFNPEMQTKKFDPEQEYVRKWVPEYKSSSYPKPMIDHTFARMRAVAEYSAALKGKK